MSISAVIPVREGSTRVKNKNIRSFFDSSLLEIKINQLKRIEEIDQIIVSSDSKIMLAKAADMGVLAVERPREYCDEMSKSFNEVVSYIAGNEVDTDVMMWVPCVCPLVKDESIREGIRIYNELCATNHERDSVATAVLIKEYLFDEKGPVNFSIKNHVKSQDLPNWHYIVNGFFIAETSKMAEWGFVYGKNPYLYELEKYEAIDIDDETDFKLAETLYEMKIGLPRVN